MRTCRAILLTIFFAPPQAEVLEWEAPDLFERSTVDRVRLSKDRRAIELEEGELFEDDGPAAGFSYKPNEEILKDGMAIRKDLLIPDPRARAASLLIGSVDSFRVSINGKPAALEGTRTTGKYWRIGSFDPSLLRAGLNQIVLEGPGRIWIARDDEYAAGSRTRTTHPNRSLKSVDGGKTWDDVRLGTAGNVDGEYYVRVLLNRFHSRGEMTLPVVDLGQGKPLSSIGPLRVAAKAEGRIAVRVRTGPTVHPEDGTWTAWKEPEGNPAGRFLQAKVELTTSDPLQTPRLQSVRIQAKPVRTPDWTAPLKLTGFSQGAVLRTSIPFEDEPFDHPKLKALREQHGLDDVVKGANGEFETIVRLATWVSGRWQKMHLSESYPPWDAMEILRARDDGVPVGGFCQQYNLVLLQACQSFGIPGRAVSVGQGEAAGQIPGSGHEVVEIWSNDHRTWVYIDANTGWYFEDQELKQPLSLLDLRGRQLSALRGRPFRPVRIVPFARTRHSWKGLKDWPAFLELRLIPRSNFLEAKSPLPLNQGMRGWFWTGHAVWTDDELPASPIYSRLIRRQGDFDWGLNQVGITLEPTVTPGEFNVHLETVTPGFETFLADVDGAGAKPVVSGFRWKLHAGMNRLDVSSRNRAGRTGPLRSATIESP